ncbi:efflux transporter outer membrane subunit [Pseudomonas orientalis]|uniref:efflux transporter outer membrane subunit n=1 Tax=Pseudomonas orientalis TaxID=76758 RepID=UPI002FE3CB1C
MPLKPRTAIYYQVKNIKPFIRLRTSRTRLALSLIVLLVLAGCSVAPLPQLNPAPPDAWRNSRAYTAPAHPEFKQWWHAFGDPELDALVIRALQKNLDVAEATERLRATRILSQRAQSPYLPALGIKTTDAVSPDTSTSYLLLGLDAQWELPLFGAKQSADRLAHGHEALMTGDLRTVRVSLVAEVSSRWIELRAAQQLEATLSAIEQVQRKKLELLLVREHLNLTASPEIAKARAELARCAMALNAPRQTINRSAQQLALLVGQSEPDPLWLQPGPPPKLGPWQLTSLPADLLRTRPEISIAEAQVLIAAGELGMSRADIYPRISLGASLQWSVNIASNRKRTRSGDSIFSAGPGISIPLFDWGQRLANAQAKDHQLQAAVLAYQQSVLQGVAETETALGDLEQLRVYEQSSLHALTESQAYLAALEQRARLGLLSELDIDDARIEKLNALQQVARANAERGLAYITLYKALGGAPLPADTLKDID